ncbi:MAG TPA: response regulator [Verrucomicrobiae bacterium]|nr:response regulator [Verrucomicrobiae bacterium]
MKKILIVEDNQIVANVYRNKLVVEGYQVEIAPDGEIGLKVMRTFKPDMIVLDLMLPKMTGVDVIKQIRSENDFAKLPVIVFSNTYLTNLIQEAWKAGATKCLSKASCSPKEILDLVRATIGESGTMPQSRIPTEGAYEKKPLVTDAPPKLANSLEADTVFQVNLQKSFNDSLPATLSTLRGGLQNLVKADGEVLQLKQIYELHRRIHALTGNAGIAGLVLISKMSDAIEALLKELYEKPKNINPSTLRTVANAIDFLGFLFERGTATGKQEIPAVSILVVDDEAISRRAVVYALDKAQLHSTNVEDPNEALKLLTENHYDLVFLDVDMPGMTGYELCSKLRAMPQHKKTPVVFVTALSGFENRTSSMMAGGNDFIAKPFLFIELTVKALIHVLRGKLQPVK